MTKTRTEATAEEIADVLGALNSVSFYKTTAQIMRDTALTRTRALRALEAAREHGVDKAETYNGTYWGIQR